MRGSDQPELLTEIAGAQKGSARLRSKEKTCGEARLPVYTTVRRSGIRDQGSGIRDQGSGIRDQGSDKRIACAGRRTSLLG
jgi:hypothetical protein